MLEKEPLVLRTPLLKEDDVLKCLHADMGCHLRPTRVHKVLMKDFAKYEI
jgi:hypothetical protein